MESITNKAYHYLGKDWVFLSIIMLTGTILRVWNYANIPFMHDELSALSRLQFDSLSEIIKHGVMLGDTHPAGIQVFLYLWTLLGGTSEPWVKFPFVVAGILSIWLAYKIGKLLFDNVSGLLTAAMIATTQFFIMYSQISRPYSSGLLFTLLMTYFWCAYFFRKRTILNLFWFVIFAAFSAYNHHFSLLFAAIVGLSGLVLLKSRKEFVIYSLSGLAIFILYIPHLNIFFTQLAKGGIGGKGGWLSAPEPSFFFDFFNYMLHFSIWSWLIIIIVILLLLVTGKAIVHFQYGTKKRVILVVWFLLPLLVGYFYSILVNPIIQYSLLIFSTPYIYMVLFSFHKKVTNGKLTVLISLLLIVNTFSLIWERQHYHIFYRQPYEELFKTAILDYQNEDVYIINDCVPYYNEYYFQKFGKEIPYTTKRNTKLSRRDFLEMVCEIKNDIIVTHAIDEEEYRIVKEYFPYVLDVKQGFTYDIITFAKDNRNQNQTYDKPIAFTDFDKSLGNWINIEKGIIIDTSSNKGYLHLGNNIKWGPAITFLMDSIAPDGYGVIDAVVEYEVVDSVSSLLLVGSITDGDEIVFWGSSNIVDFSVGKSEILRLPLGIDLQTAVKGRKDLSKLKLKFNIWNKEGVELKIYSFEIFLRPGNPLRYSLYNKI